MSKRVFLGWTSIKLGLMYLAQGHNTVTPVRLKPATHRLESSTLPLSHWVHTVRIYKAFHNAIKLKILIKIQTMCIILHTCITKRQWKSMGSSFEAAQEPNKKWVSMTRKCHNPSTARKRHRTLTATWQQGQIQDFWKGGFRCVKERWGGGGGFADIISKFL